MGVALLIWGFVQRGFTSALGFFSKPPGSYIGAAAILALSLWWFGQHEFNNGYLAAQEEAAGAARPIIVKQGEITHDVVTKYVTVAAETKAKIVYRIKEVPIHVTEKADAACVVPLGFVRVFNDAAHGPVPGPAAGTDDAASGVALSEVAKTSVQNAGEYDLISEQLKALQEWVRKQQAANQ